MTRLKWWFRLVGGWYLLLATMNVYIMLIAPEMMSEQLPYAANEGVIRAFVDGWSPFLFEMIGIGLFALWASRTPARFVSAAWLLVALEFAHGVVDDLFLIMRGYSAGGYIAFIAIHLLIMVTGLWATRQHEEQGAAVGLVPSR